MIGIQLGLGDVSRIRFARSPLQETLSSLQLLGDPDRERRRVHRPWLEVAEPLAAGLGLRLLPALVGGRHYVADFLTPPPERLDVAFGDEVERVRASSDADVRTAVTELFDGGPIDLRLAALMDAPAKELGRLAGELTAYWRAVVEPVWPRLRALLDADLGHRAQALTGGGVAGLLKDLHPKIDYAGELLRVDAAGWDCRHMLRGTGVLLVPCAFAWPKLVILTNEPYQPMLTYGPRGIATLWDAGGRKETRALGELLGHSRAGLLARLDLPMTTTQLAAGMGLTPATVSEHLAVLRRTRLVTSRRSGRVVLYQRTALAAELLGAT
ncbi:helix-turn-helix domain-containing protein [Nonomuraea sp. NBC_01738]|uniref:ArsR/SmtB family transcription factor n=1 Tax=Nonomuraea sp. NBC_01738 TaxID=2976003 RepID=UPI002E15D775|nr:helix-turn-helix domain-containing protein [Nonomuraea sp. NBC_01738]